MSSVWDYHMMKGPWRILSQCPSTKHNSWTAAREGIDGVHCICPRAIDMLRERMPGSYKPIGIPWRISEDCIAVRHNIPVEWMGKGRGPACTCPASEPYMKIKRAKDSARRKNYAASIKKKKEKEMGIAASLVKGMPDLRRGLCRIKSNIPVFDAAFDDGEAGRVAAKSVCHSCPVIQECDAWVLQYEAPGGDWGGVYAGKDVYDRRNGWQPARPLVSMERKSVEVRLKEADERKTKTPSAARPHNGMSSIKSGGYRWSVR